MGLNTNNKVLMVLDMLNGKILKTYKDVTELKLARWENKENVSKSVQKYGVWITKPVLFCTCIEPSFLYFHSLAILDEETILFIGPKQKQVSRFNLKTGNNVIKISKPPKEALVWLVKNLYFSLVNIYCSNSAIGFTSYTFIKIQISEVWSPVQLCTKKYEVILVWREIRETFFHCFHLIHGN